MAGQLSCHLFLARKKGTARLIFPITYTSVEVGRKHSLHSDTDITTHPCDVWLSQVMSKQLDSYMSTAAWLPKSGVMQQLGLKTMDKVTCGCGRANWTACRVLVGNCVSSISDTTILTLILLTQSTNKHFCRQSTSTTIPTNAAVHGLKPKVTRSIQRLWCSYSI